MSCAKYWYYFVYAILHKLVVEREEKSNTIIPSQDTHLHNYLLLLLVLVLVKIVNARRQKLKVSILKKAVL